MCVLYTEQHPRGSFACFESRSVFPRLTVKPGCCSQWLFCVERIPLNATVCSPGVISTHPLHRRQGGEETSLQMCTLDSVHALSRVCAKSHSDRGTHTYMHTLIHTQTHTETLSPEQWQATAQDVYVTSRVCEKLFGVAVETKCNIEKSRLSVHSSLSVEKSQSIRESQASSPTLAAAARLSAMIHGKDQVYANAMLVDQVSCSSFSIQCH